MASENKSKGKQNDLLQQDLENVKRKTAKANHAKEDTTYDEKKTPGSYFYIVLYQ